MQLLFLRFHMSLSTKLSYFPNLLTTTHLSRSPPSSLSLSLYACNDIVSSKFFLLFDFAMHKSSGRIHLTNVSYFFFFFIGHMEDHMDHMEMFDWLSQSFIEPDTADSSQSCYNFVTADYNELPSDLSEDPLEQNKKQMRVCKECGKSFSRNDSLRRHKKLYCKVKTEIQCCRYCGEKFDKPHSLRNHLISAHASKLVNTERKSPAKSP